MLFEIDDHKTIRDIQQEFSSLFPFLKIEFFDKLRKRQRSSATAGQNDIDQKIGNLHRQHNPGALQVYPLTRTCDLEDAIKNHFGLNVRVFRNMDGEWVQTVGADNLTLEEQDEIGRKSQTVIHPDYNERIEEGEY